MSKRSFLNHLNELDPKTWLKFQKSWFIHNPPKRPKGVLRHPAKFPETLAQDFIEFFTKRNGVVLDPMAGTGSTLLAALRSGRRSYGIELNAAYTALAQKMIQEERLQLDPTIANLSCEIVSGDANDLLTLTSALKLPPVDYVLTSPPYWNMLHVQGAATQRKRRASKILDVTYSDDPRDLGNLEDYEVFLDRLASIYEKLPLLLRPKAYLTIIVKNVKKGGRMYPLAWDLAQRLSQTFTLKDERIWCQDDIRLAPYGLGSAWVSNTFHHYCLQFRYEPRPERL